MKPKTGSNMETRDLKEMAWDEYGREAYEAEMKTRFIMDTYPEEGGAQEGTEDKAGKEAGL